MADAKDKPSIPDWQRPPFEEGNKAAVTHGAHSAEIIEPIAEAIAAEAVGSIPYLAAPEFRHAVRAWSWVEAQLARIEAYIDEHGLFDAEGKPTTSVEILLRFDRSAREARKALGLDPASRIAIEKDLSSIAGSRGDLSTLAEQGRAALAARNGGGEES